MDERSVVPSLLKAHSDTVCSKDEGHEHLGRATICRVGFEKHFSQIALLNRGAIEEVDTRQRYGNEPRPAQRHRGADTRQQDA